MDLLNLKLVKWSFSFEIS